ncbi:MAG: ABC transporter permease [Gemmatimonadaceae bacterium]
MSLIPGLKRPFRRVVHGPTIAEDVDAEIAFHLEMRAEQLAAAGLAPAVARAEALKQFGNLDAFTNDCRVISRQRERDMRRFDLMDALRQDLRYAARQLRRSPGFTAVAILLLALGIGATSAIFSVVSALLLRPLPYAHPEQLAMLAEYSARDESAKDGMTTSYANFLDWHAQATSFEGMAVVQEWSPSLSGNGEPERIKAALVYPEMFRVFDARPMLGRGFLPEEAAEGSEIRVVLSHGFWQRRFGGDRAIVGKTIILNARARTVVGVLPAGFRAPPPLDGDLWGNLPFDPSDDCRTCRHLRVFARVKPTVPPARVRAELGAIAARLEAAYPKENAFTRIAFVPLRERVVGRLREPLWLLLGAASLVLLIACANLSNLLIARGVARAREFAIRTALGANRARAVRQLLTESVLLAAVGGAAGLALALLTTRWLAAVGPQAVRAGEVGVDWRVIAFSAALTLVTGLAFGMVPALKAATTDVHEFLKEGARGSTSGGGARLRGALVVSQLAIALTLLVGASLLIKSFARLQRVDPGLRPAGVLTLTISLPSASYPTPESRSAFFTRLIERAEALPGVRSAAATTNIPLSGNMDRVGFGVEGQTYTSDADMPTAERYIVTPGYFATLGIALKSGRLLTPDDRVGRAHVMVVDDALERQLWPGESAVGKRIRGAAGGDSIVSTVVGVVGHVRHYGLEVESGGQLYVPFLARPSSYSNVLVRTAGDPLALASAVRREVRALDPNLPIFDVTSMEQFLDASVAGRRFIMGLLGAFAGVAIVMAAVGLYGVVAYAVSQRTREIGLRMALGAQRSDVTRMVVREGVVLTAVGVAVGLAAATASTRLMASLLYGVSATDPLVMAGVPALLFAVALLATWLPARRAARVDPMVALRSE